MKLDQSGFGEFRLDTAEQSLSEQHERLALAPKSFTLCSSRADRRAARLYADEQAVLGFTKTELLDCGGANIHLGDAVFKRCISQIRDALGDNADAPRFIETVQGRSPFCIFLQVKLPKISLRWCAPFVARRALDTLFVGHCHREARLHRH